AAPVRDRRRRALRHRRRDHGAGGRPCGAKADRRRPGAATTAGGREGPARGLRVRQRRNARRSGCIRRRRDDRPPDVKRALGLVLLVGALLATFATLQSSKPGWWERLWYPLSYEQIVRGHARNYDLDPALLAAVIYQESKFKADARSTSGAIGLMQLLPDTAKGIALHTGGSRFRVEDLYDPEINVRYGAFYLHRLLTKYGDTKLALAAYNAGQANVDAWRAEGRGIVFPETREYVDSVLETREVYA